MSYQLIPADKGTFPPIPLQRPVLLVGRHPECDFRLDLPKISRRHCCLALAYDRVLIRDLGSHNGLRVNGQLVEEAQLHPGDEVAIGPLIYRLVEQREVPEAGSSKESTGPPTKAQQPTLTLPDAAQDDEIGLVPLDDL
jgi:pSer/pThr/pTyr-binding forkhead associated (FHA) protein